MLGVGVDDGDALSALQSLSLDVAVVVVLGPSLLFLVFNALLKPSGSSLINRRRRRRLPKLLSLFTETWPVASSLLRSRR